MKYLTLLLFLAFGLTSVQAQPRFLPTECKKNLDNKIKDWKYAEIQETITYYHRQEKFPFEPNFVE